MTNGLCWPWQVAEAVQKKGRRAGPACVLKSCEMFKSGTASCQEESKKNTSNGIGLIVLFRRYYVVAVHLEARGACGLDFYTVKQCIAYGVCWLQVAQEKTLAASERRVGGL